MESNGGFAIGAMQKVLLEKIEELYLHVIQLEKQNKELEYKVNRQMNADISTLEERIETLEALIIAQSSSYAK